VNEGLERLRELLKEEGLYAAQVSADTVPHTQDHQMDVIIIFTPDHVRGSKKCSLRMGRVWKAGKFLRGRN